MELPTACKVLNSAVTLLGVRNGQSSRFSVNSDSKEFQFCSFKNSFVVVNFSCCHGKVMEIPQPQNRNCFPVRHFI